MTRTPGVLVLCAAAAVGLSPSILAQSLQERIQNLRDTNSPARSEARAVTAGVDIRGALRTNLGDVNLDGMTARDAFAWVGQQANLPLQINWEQLSTQDAIDPDQVVQLRGRGISADLALQMLAEQIAIDEELIIEPTAWYVEVMSKNQANRKSVIRVYPIGDLLVQAPNFVNAPAFDLAQITQTSGGGGGQGTGGLVGGGGGGGLFGGGAGGGRGGGGPGGGAGADVGIPREILLDDLIRLITETVEPEIWQSNGGLYGSISPFSDNLVIRAPMYVHRQIGRTPAPTVGTIARGGALPAATQTAAPSTSGTTTSQPITRTRGASRSAGISSGAGTRAASVSGSR